MHVKDMRIINRNPY